MTGAAPALQVEWPAGLARWLPLVLPDDVLLPPVGACRGCGKTREEGHGDNCIVPRDACMGCAQPVDHEHASGCWAYARRLERRHEWIARYHLSATHPLTPPHVAARSRAIRNMLCADLDTYDAGNVEMLKSEIRRLSDGYFSGAAEERAPL